MAFTLFQAGTSLQLADTSGALSTLTLPTGVALSAGAPPRWQVYGNYVFLVNSPTSPLSIDALGVVRPLTPRAPRTAPVVAAGTSGSLSGTYAGVRYTFIIKDANGEVIAESDMSPASGTVTISSKFLQVTGVEISSETAVTGRRLYRPTSSGTTLFPWVDIDGNAITSIQDDLSDAGLSLLSAPNLGNPPRLTLIKEWRNRLFGVGDIQLDTLRYSEPDAWWAWPSTNGLSIPGIGRDQFGIKALMPRREALGVGRRDLIWQITGETPDDFAAIKLSEITGVESNETVATYRDTVWWLWKDGVYQWDADGLRNISDGKVKSWFSTNSYFNRDMFQYAFAEFDPVRLKYKLFLAAAGSTSIDRWIDYDIQTGTWWGPHKTDAFSPTSAFNIIDSSDKILLSMGSSSYYIWKEQATPTDHIQTGISLDVTSRFFDGSLPEYEKYWGEMSVMGKVQSTGTMTFTPKTGYLDAVAQSSITYDMTTGRQRLARLGTGKLLQLRLQHSAAAEGVEIYGFEVPYSIIGHR